MTDPSVSVIIPAFGQVVHLLRAVESALAQTLLPLEVIVIDDGTHRPIVLPISDPRVRVVRMERNCGPSAARNLGCRTAQGDWIAFLDADDAWRPNKLAVQLRDTSAQADLLLACNVLIVDHNGCRPYNSSVPAAALDRWILVDDQSLQTSGLVLPRHVALRFPFDETLRACEDWDLVLRLNAENITIKYEQACLSLYFYSKKQKTRTKNELKSIINWIKTNRYLEKESVAHYYFDKLFLINIKNDVFSAILTSIEIFQYSRSTKKIIIRVLIKKVRKFCYKHNYLYIKDRQ